MMRRFWSVVCASREEIVIAADASEARRTAAYRAQERGDSTASWCHPGQASVTGIDHVPESFEE